MEGITKNVGYRMEGITENVGYRPGSKKRQEIRGEGIRTNVG